MNQRFMIKLTLFYNHPLYRLYTWVFDHRSAHVHTCICIIYMYAEKGLSVKLSWPGGIYSDDVESIRNASAGERCGLSRDYWIITSKVPTGLST